MSGVAMNSVTRLDQMLYAWLAERDDTRFERAFERYYEAAFTGLVRYLGRRSNSPDLDLEQIAVDALLKFFSRVGPRRREASDSIERALPLIQPLDFGPYHIRLVRRWTGDVGAFREEATRFNLEENDGDRPWKEEIDSLAAKIAPLQRQGCHVLEPLRTAVASIARDEPPAILEQVAADPAGEGLFEEVGEEDPAEGYALVRDFTTGLRSDADAGSASHAAVERRYPGALQFAEGTWTVIQALPELRLPTNGYLFDMAQSLFLDECKARSRLKRGGARTPGEDSGIPEANRPIDALHPAAQISLDDDAEGQSFRPMTMVFAADVAEFADPESEHVGEEFCQKFYAYLRRPLDAAERAYRAAAAGGPAKAERKRWESVAKKTDRILSVLSMRIEGQTQEAIAEAQGISRNQVKYIVELVQEAYEQFTAASARAPVRPSTAGDFSHVQ